MKVLALFALSLSAQAPPPDTLIVGDGWRLEATGVSVAVAWEDGVAVIRVAPSSR
jgi:hypothetical protein